MIEWLFKYPESAFAAGTLELNHPDYIWWGLGVATVVVAATLFFGRAIRRIRFAFRFPVLALQWAAIALVGLILAEPVLQIARLAQGVNTVAIAIDASASMGLEANGTTRLAIAERAHDELRERLGDGVDTHTFIVRDRVATFDGESGSVARTLAADGRSRLQESLADIAESLSATALAGIVLLSDGAENQLEDPSRFSTVKTPVHSVAIGPDVLTNDLELEHVDLPPSSNVGADVVARVAIRHDTDRTARIRVTEGADVVASEQVVLTGTGTTVARITVPSEAAGLRELRFEVVLDDGVFDPIRQNNARTAGMSIDERTFRVLYLEGEPRWEFKFVRRAASADDAIDLGTWLKTSPRKSLQQGLERDALDEGFPADLEALFAYDLIILGSIAATEFSAEQHEQLESFVVDRGGSLLVIAGRNSLTDGGWDAQPLTKTLPIYLNREDGPTYQSVTGFAVPTDEGASTDTLDLGPDGWDALPELADYQTISAVKPAASTLLNFQPMNSGIEAQPLLVEQVVGFGRTMVLATASTWRWKMQTAADDSRHERFWRQLIRHLAGLSQQREKLVVETEGGTLRIKASARDAQFVPIDAPPTATVRAADGATETVALLPTGTGYEATVPTSASGTHLVSVDFEGDRSRGLARLANITGVDEEFFAPAADRAYLADLAERTGGRLWSAEDINAIADAIELSSTGIREQIREPLWDAPAWFLLLLLLKVAEWSFRRLGGGI